MTDETRSSRPEYSGLNEDFLLLLRRMAEDRFQSRIIALSESARQTILEGLRRMAALSGREREVFILISKRRTDQEIAADFSIATETIRKYRKRIYRKLGLPGNGSLSEYAAELGFLLNTAMEALKVDQESDSSTPKADTS